MATEDLLEKAQEEIEKGLKVCHCDKCGCMIEALGNINKFLDSQSPGSTSSDFQDRVKAYLKELKLAESS